MTYLLGIDPGGKRKFGLAKLFMDGTIETSTVSSVREAISRVNEMPLGVGIDCPLWWSDGVGGTRNADKWIRDTYKLPSRNVQSVNSMWGAVLVQGVLFAMKIREKYPEVNVTESHPKALMKALSLDSDIAISRMFGLRGRWANEDERDAVIAATCARMGFTLQWTVDLAAEREEHELNPKKMWFGPLNYWWPNIANS